MQIRSTPQSQVRNFLTGNTLSYTYAYAFSRDALTRVKFTFIDDVRLLPTLARWGFVEAAMIIREHASAIDGLVEVFETGGGVGDAIAVIERNVAAASPNSALTLRRTRRIKLESEVKQRDFSTYNAIEAIGNAKLLATPGPDPEDLEPIELIKGTSRTYTRAELILPPNPSPSQVKTLAREIMMNRLQADEVQHGKASERTKKDITTLYEQVSAALQVYENTEEAKIGVAKDFESPPLAKGTTIFKQSQQKKCRYLCNFFRFTEQGRC